MRRFSRPVRRTGHIAAQALCAAALAVALPAGLPAAAPLDTELSHLLQTHPRISAARKGIEASEAGIDEARSGYFPSVSLSGEVGPDYADSPSRRSVQGEAFSDTRRTSTLTVTQNLFEGFRTDAETRIARLRKDVSSHTYRITEQTYLFNGIQAYLNVLKQSRLLDIAKINEQTLQEQLQLENARVERGSGLAVDVLQAKSRLQLARERVVTIFGDLRLAMSIYMQLYGRPAVPAEMSMPTPPRDALPETLEGAIEIAKAENVVLRRSLTQVDIASEQRTVAESTYWPRIDIVGEGTLEKDTDGVAGINREGKVVLRAVWDLFDGYLTPAKTARASAEYGVALDSRLETDRDVRDRVRRAWEQYRTSLAQRDLLENAVNIAAEVFEARKKLRQRGRESVIVLLDAENELNNARLRYNAAVFDYTASAYRLLLQTGRLNPETLGLPG